MNKKLIENFFYQSSYQLLLIILPIISVPIVSKALGPSGIGTYNYTYSIVNYFVLVAGLGLANYAVREISFVQDNKMKLSQKFWEIQIFNLFVSTFVLLVYLVFSFFVEKRLLFIVQGLVVLATLFDISWFFQGIEEFKRVTIMNTVIKLFSFLLIILFVRKSSDLLLYTIIQSTSILLSSILFWFALGKRIEFVKVSRLEVTSHFKPALNFFILKVASTVFINFNKTLLGIFSTMSAVGLFSNSLTLITMVGSLINAMNTVLLPRMSALQSKKNENALIVALSKSLHIQLYFTIPLMFGIIAVTPKMIQWFFGTSFSDMTSLVPILAPLVVFQSLHQGIANQYLVPKNEMKSYNLTMIIGTIINVILGVILIPLFHYYGAAISFLVGQIVLTVSRSYVLIKKTSFCFNLKSILIYLLSGLIMLLVIILLTSDMSSHFITTVFQGFIGIIFYFSFTTVLKQNPLFSLRNKD